MKHLALCALLSLSAPSIAQPVTPPVASVTDSYIALDADFARWMEQSHVPGLVWGVVQDGKLVHVRAMGVQDTGPRIRPVTADTGFRIASMSKAFTGYTILKLRDAGKLRLDDPVWKYIPEIKSWAPDISIADLLHHNAGFVTDDPWGDRQQVMPEADFTRLLKAGVPRTAARGTRFEYSNMGYAILGRIITNIAGRNFADTIDAQIFKPLGMASTTYENADVPDATRAIGYRWENDQWLVEPQMRHGAFGSMGGITTSANDYAKWIAHLLSGWPAGAGDGRAKAMIRDMADGGGVVQARKRPGKEAATCRLPAIYAQGLLAGNDCSLGPVLFHGGGFPGYGSHMLLVPDAGIGVFALSNRTYAGPSGPVWDAATALVKGGFATPRAIPVSALLHDGYVSATEIWAKGDVGAYRAKLAMNFLMDSSVENWKMRLATLHEQAGDCDTTSAVVATGALSGRFTWRCTNGSITGTVLLAPLATPQIQSLGFDFTE